MLYKLKNGKTVKVPDEEIKKQMRLLGLTQAEAVQMWLEDEGYEHNPEQEALEQKAKDNRITATIHQARAQVKQKTQRERVVKPDEVKENIISKIADLLSSIGCEKIEVVKKAKLITFSMGNDDYKIDLSRKNKALAEEKAKGTYIPKRRGV